MRKVLFACFSFLVIQFHAQNEEVQDDGREIKIPIVFHISQSKKDPEISKDIIIQELKELNDNFSAKNDMSQLSPYFQSLIGNPNIKFHLADTILNYTPLKGVKVYNKRIKRFRARRINRFNNDSILHIIVGKIGSASSVLVNRNHPISVNISIGSFGNSSNTVTHEVGHYLGLWHVWGNTNCKRNKRGSVITDSISDTPFQKNCTDLSRKIDCPTPNAVERPNYNNFMDYSKCRNFFTNDQAETMRRKIIEFRRNLYEKSK